MMIFIVIPFMPKLARQLFSTDKQIDIGVYPNQAHQFVVSSCSP